MADRSGFTRFLMPFESALRAYEMGVTLAEYPFAVQLQSCISVESIMAILKYKARAFSGLQGNDRILKSMESSVSILSKLSTPAFV